MDPPSCPPPESGAGCNENSVIARFRVQSFVDPVNGDPNFADFATEQRLLRYNQPFPSTTSASSASARTATSTSAVETGGRKATR